MMNSLFNDTSTIMKRETALAVFNLCNSAVIFTVIGLFNFTQDNTKGAYTLLGIAIAEILAVSIILGIVLFRKAKN